MAADGIKFVSTGAKIDYTPSSAVAGGDIIDQSDLVGIATQDIAANALGSLAIEGVFDFPKATSAVSFSAGDKAYYNTSSKVAVTAPGTNVVFIGKAIADAAETDSTVRVKLLQLDNLAEIDPAALVTPTQDALTDSSGGSASTTLAAVTNLSALTLTNMTGTAATTPAAETNTTELTDNGGGTADGTVAAQAAPTTLTDNTGGSGTHDDTLAAVTPGTAPAITYTANDPSIVPDAAVTIADGTTPTVAELLEFCEELKKTAADNATAVGVLMQNQSDAAQKVIELVTLAGTAQNNLKEVTTELATQRTLNATLINDAKLFAEQLVVQRAANTALVNAVASMAAQLAKVKVDVAAVLTSLKNAGLMKSA